MYCVYSDDYIDKAINYIINELKLTNWSDEFSIVRPLTYFVPIFYSKYCIVGHSFYFEIVKENNKWFLRATNVSDFSYVFPLS